MAQPAGRNAAHCPGWPLQPQRCFASRCAGRACGAPLTLETSASPAGLTARARPEARPEERATNLRRWRRLAAQVRAEEAQGSYRMNMKWSWLQNPAVALIELLASVIAVVQSVAWLC